jgi:predicted DNA-binding protein
MPSRNQVEKFVRMVEGQKYIEAMEEFYAADATAQENNEPPRIGLSALLDNERKTLATFGRAEARCVAPIIIDGDRVVIQWEFSFKLPSGVKLRLEEVAMQTWKGEKLASERFFYDSRQLRP